MSSSNDELVKSLDSGLNKCGNVLGTICAVICVLVIIGLITSGIISLVNAKKIEKNTTNVSAKILSINNQDNKCALETITTTTNNRTTTQQIYHCNLIVTYKYNNKEFTGNLLTNDIDYKVGMNIDILVDNSEPTKIYYAKEIKDEDTTGKILFAIGSVLIIFTIIHIILLRKFTFYKKMICVEQSVGWLRALT